MSKADNARDEALLDVGRQCSAPLCGLVDFLPFKCQSCAQPFCGDHYLPASHKCEKYDERAHNRIAPSCEHPPRRPHPRVTAHRARLRPAVQHPRRDPARAGSERPHGAPLRRGVLRPDRQDREEEPGVRPPQVRQGALRAHQLRRASPLPLPLPGVPVAHARPPFQKCKLQFCPAHRFPNTHTCTASASSAPAPPTANTPNLAAGGAAAMAAIKRSLATAPTSSAAKPSARPAAPAPAPTPSGSKPRMFSAADRYVYAARLALGVRSSTMQPFSLRVFFPAA